MRGGPAVVLASSVAAAAAASACNGVRVVLDDRAASEDAGLPAESGLQDAHLLRADPSLVAT